MTIAFTYQDAVQSDTTTLRIYKYEDSQWIYTSISSLTVTKSTSSQITVTGWSTHTATFATFFSTPPSFASRSFGWRR